LPVLLGLGFLFGLSIPGYSFLAIVAAAGLVATMPFRLHRSWRITIPLLLTFTFIHQGISVYYGFQEPSVLLIHPLTFLSAYFLGLALPSIDPTPDRRWLSRVILATVTGMALFALLGAYLKPLRIEGADLFRKAPTFWDPNVVLNGTIYGLYASVGMVMMPLFLFGGRKSLGTGLADRVLALIACGFGLAANLLFQNRSPMFALGAALLFVGADLVRRNGPQPGARRHTIWTLILVVVLVFVGSLAFSEELELALFRFQAFGLSSGGRLDAWHNVVAHILDQPFGGRRIDLAGLSYAHDLWLDVANDSGLVPMILLLSFVLLHLPAVRRLLGSAPGIGKYAMVCLGIALLMGALVEPLLIGSPSHFAMICLLLGLASGTSSPPLGVAEEHSGVEHPGEQSVSA
jgi:hypothetical protein